MDGAPDDDGVRPRPHEAAVHDADRELHPRVRLRGLLGEHVRKSLTLPLVVAHDVDFVVARQASEFPDGVGGAALESGERRDAEVEHVFAADGGRTEPGKMKLPKPIARG